MSSSMTRTAGLVVITPLATHEVAEDIAARLARARVFQPEGWDIVRQLFQAKETDARLGRYVWMPQSLDRRRGARPLPARGQRLPRPGDRLAGSAASVPGH
jgi:hypothetical protein